MDHLKFELNFVTYELWKVRTSRILTKNEIRSAKNLCNELILYSFSFCSGNEGYEKKMHLVY